MKNTLKLILLGVSVLGVASCGGESSGVSFDPNNNTLGYQWQDKNSVIVSEKGSVQFRIIAAKNSLAEEYSKMKVFTDLYDSTNVKINWQNLTESQYASQKSLILSRNKQYPDAIYHASFTNKELIQYGTQRKAIIAIDDYLEYMPNFKAILDSRPDVRKAISSPDGHIYSLPRVEEMGLKQYPNLLFINKEWVGKLIDENRLSFPLTKADLVDGLKLTRNQYKEILGYFKRLDINGDGKTDDEIPLSFVHNNWQGNESDLMASFGIPENKDHKTIVDGRVVFTCQDEKWKNAVSELSTWVKDGLIDLAAFEDTQDAFLSKGKVVDGGKQRLGSFYWWEMETVISEQDHDDYIVMEPLVDDETGKQYVGVSNELEIEKGECVIFNKCEYKEILLTYLDRFYDPYTSAQLNYGPKGIVFEEELVDGKLVTKALPNDVNADELRLKNAPMGCLYLSYEQWENNVNMEPRAVLRLDRLEKYEKPHKFENAASIPNINYTLEEINTLASKEAELTTAINTQFIEWILAGKAISDSDWNSFQSVLVRAGIETIKNTNQAGYDRYING